MFRAVRCALCALMGVGERYAALMAGWMVFWCEGYCDHALAEGVLVSRSWVSFRLVRVYVRVAGSGAAVMAMRWQLSCRVPMITIVPRTTPDIL